MSPPEPDPFDDGTDAVVMLVDVLHARQPRWSHRRDGAQTHDDARRRVRAEPGTRRRDSDARFR
jgi:hypothetical protein